MTSPTTPTRSATAAADQPSTGAAGTSTEIDIDVARFRLAIVRLARRQRQQAGTGLTSSLQSALAVLDVHGPLTLGELAGLEQISPPTTTRIVSKLEEMDLVERTTDPDDRRVCRVAVTGEGHRQMVESRERRDVWLRQRLDDLTADEIAALAAAVEPIERLLEATDGAGLDR